MYYLTPGPLVQTVTLKIRRQGNSLGITLPKAMTEALDLRSVDRSAVPQRAQVTRGCVRGI